MRIVETETVITVRSQCVMSKSICKLVLKYNDKSWPKTLRGDWEKHYGDISKFVTKRTGKKIDTDCHITVGNDVVSSSDTFKCLITDSKQSPTHVIVVVCNECNITNKE